MLVACLLVLLTPASPRRQLVACAPDNNGDIKTLKCGPLPSQSVESQWAPDGPTGPSSLLVGRSVGESKIIKFKHDNTQTVSVLCACGSWSLYVAYFWASPQMRKLCKITKTKSGARDSKDYFENRNTLIFGNHFWRPRGQASFPKQALDGATEPSHHARTCR